MKLANKLYPYPVLNNESNDYINSKFDIDVTFKKTKKSITFYFKVELDEESLWEFINQDNAFFCVHLECNSSCYRELFKFNEPTYQVEISSDKLNAEVDLCCFIIANNNIELNDNPNFNEVYYGIKFNIDKYNILAIGTQRSIIIEKDYDPLKNIRSIFTVIPDDEEKQLISMDYSGNIIQIFIPRKQYSIYKNISSYTHLIPTIHSALIIPVLIEIFEMFKRDENSWDEYEDKSWFRSIKKALDNININLDPENNYNINSVRYAQLIIDSPILKVFDGLFSIDNMENDL